MSPSKALFGCLIALGSANSIAEPGSSQYAYEVENEVISVGNDVWRLRKTYSEGGVSMIFHNNLPQSIRISNISSGLDLNIAPRESFSTSCAAIAQTEYFEVISSEGYPHSLSLICGDSITLSKGD